MGCPRQQILSNVPTNVPSVLVPMNVFKGSYLLNQSVIDAEDLLGDIGVALSGLILMDQTVVNGMKTSKACATENLTAGSRKCFPSCPGV